MSEIPQGSDLPRHPGQEGYTPHVSDFSEVNITGADDAEAARNEAREPLGDNTLPQDGEVGKDIAVSPDAVPEMVAPAAFSSLQEIEGFLGIRSSRVDPLQAAEKLDTGAVGQFVDALLGSQDEASSPPEKAPEAEHRWSVEIPLADNSSVEATVMHGTEGPRIILAEMLPNAADPNNPYVRARHEFGERADGTAYRSSVPNYSRALDAMRSASDSHANAQLRLLALGPRNPQAVTDYANAHDAYFGARSDLHPEQPLGRDEFAALQLALYTMAHMQPEE